MKVVHENKFCQAYYDEVHKIVWNRYIDLVNPDLLIEMHRAVMKFVVQNPTVACFYDLTNMKGTFTKTLNFLIKEYEPTLYKNNVIYGSFAMNEKDVFMKFAMNQMFKVMSTKMELKVHKTIDEACKWLGEKMNATVVMPELPKMVKA
ncbi:hypothetical protein QWY31_00425 [Cytophagales bacterium LB-30]|uniref:STAS/SEC14 domain-containing protein n=1 Tax=Shiella aurantiaca TaxID=3058365 RepID=A0ABT8F0K5_9BACT|nr:hypothetical protein [Shiella aurantiaca]MDN4163940.1 hypothetical protein [Shiella aurantiaca]